jgi:flavin reductase (DIM6/NTAB) family NADH-FMN oxidoreductase RutF
MDFREIKTNAIADNMWKLLKDDWMLVTAGSMDSWNTMTASWGGFGHLWNKDVAFVFIRPTRHTYSFIEKSERLTLSFFDYEWHKALEICGEHSGRDVNKAEMTGLKPLEVKSGYIAFEQAKTIFICNVIAKYDLNSKDFIDSSINSHYNNDFHRVYTAEIITILQG